MPAQSFDKGRHPNPKYLRRAAVVGITWPLPADVALERKLFTPPFTFEPSWPQPDWARIHAVIISVSTPQR